jgi:phosphoribosylpyrophosphate synthetase
MAYQVRKPDIILVSENDILGTMIAKDIGCDTVPFRREYHDDGSPAARIDLNYTITDYDSFKRKKVLTVYRRRQLPDRNSVARHLVNYPSIVFDLTDKDTFGVDEVDVMYPYWIRGRADHNPRTDDDQSVRIRDKGRGIGYKFEAAMFKAAGASRILTLHPHFHREPGTIDVEGIEVVCLDAVPGMVRYAQEGLGISKDCLVVSPDLKPARAGRYDIALQFAKFAELDSSHLEKQRLTGSESVSKTVLDAKDRDVVIVDDIGSTMGTVKGAVQNIKNAKSVDVMLVHAVLPYVGLSAVNELMGSDDYRVRSVTATHTIASDISRIPINDVVAGFYKDGNTATAVD